MPDRNNPDSRGRIRDVIKNPSISKDDTPKSVIQKIGVLKKKFKTLNQDFKDEYNARVQKMQDDEQSIKDIESSVRIKESSLEKRIGEFKKEKEVFEKFKFDSLDDIVQKNKNIELQHKDINANNKKIKKENDLIKEVKKYLSQSLEEVESMKVSAKSLEDEALDDIGSLNKRKHDCSILRDKLQNEISTNKKKSIELDRLIKEHSDLVDETDVLKGRLEDELKDVPAIKEKLNKDTKELDVSIKKTKDIEILQVAENENINKEKDKLKSKKEYLLNLRKEINKII